MKKILVTGSSGQLGNELAELAKLNTPFQFDFHDIDTLDLTNNDMVTEYFDKQKPDYVINCAAYTAVDKAEEEPQLAYLINADIPLNLAILAEKTGSKLIHLSSDYVFNGKNYKPYTEEDPPDPQSVYGKSKFEGEQKIIQGKNVIIIRTSWLYSRFGKNFLKTILLLGTEKDWVKVVSDQIGSPTNAFDLAQAIMKIVEFSEKESFMPGLYHYSSEGVCSWYDFAMAIKKTTGFGADVIPVTSQQYPLPAPRPHYSVLDKTRIKQTFGLSIPHWHESMRLTLASLHKF